MEIRPEKPEEFPEIYRLIQEAFRTARISDGDEQDYTDKLRAGAGYLPELALVAVTGGRIVGHIMFSRTVIVGEGGVDTEALMVAPLSVALEYRGRGIGAALMEEGLRRAADAGFGIVFLAGDPGYYSRFGFVSSARYGLDNNLGIPDPNCLIREIAAGVLDGVKGTLRFIV